MRIRKNANFLQSLLSPPPPPLPQTSPPIAPTTPPLDPPTLVCEFNRSPWDVISFLPQSELSYADGLRQVKLETDQEVKLQRVKTMKLEEDINGGDQSSNIVQRVKPKVEIKEEIEEKALIIDNLVVTTEKKKKGRKRIVGREVLNRCTKTDGRTWQCWNEADAGNTLCNHHIEQLQTYYRTVPSQKSEKSMSKAKAPTPLRRRVKKKATNTSDFYYYSGFGPLWGKSRSELKRAIKIECDIVVPPSPVNTPPIQTSNAVVDNDNEDEDNDDDDKYYDVGIGEKRIRKPIKERSLKSLL